MKFKKRKPPPLDSPFEPLSPSLSLSSTYAEMVAEMKASMARSMQQMASPNWPNLLQAQAEPEKPKPPSIDATKLESLRVAEPYKVQHRAPDYVSVLTAWRAWDVRATPDGWRLEALGKSTIWEPKTAISATCHKNDATRGIAALMRGENPTRHPAPSRDCTCGIWSFKELDNLVAAIGCDYKEVRVLGKVSLWGRVIETENGYRAEKAYPSELWLLDSSLEELGLIYDVPVRTIQ